MHFDGATGSSAGHGSTKQWRAADDRFAVHSSTNPGRLTAIAAATTWPSTARALHDGKLPRGVSEPSVVSNGLSASMSIRRNPSTVSWQLGVASSFAFAWRVAEASGACCGVGAFETVADEGLCTLTALAS